MLAVDENNIRGLLNVNLMHIKRNFEDIIEQILQKRHAVLKKWKQSMAPFKNGDIHVIILEPILRRLLPEKNLDVIRKIIKER